MQDSSIFGDNGQVSIDLSASNNNNGFDPYNTTDLGKDRYID